MSDLEPGPDPGGVDEPEILRPGEAPFRARDYAPRRAPFGLRLKLAAIIAAGGVLFLAVGTVLTLTLIGAPLGIPLALLGLALLAAALFVLLGRGTIVVGKP